MRASLTLFAGVVAALLLAPAAARADDTTPPVIVYSPPAAGSQPKGPLTITAKITDESKFYPQVFFRHGAGPYEKPIDMKKDRAGGKDMYEATIPYKGDNVEYYIEAYDDFGNGPARAGDPDSPFKLTLGEAAPPPPPPVAKQTTPAPSNSTSSSSMANNNSPRTTSSNNGAQASNSGGGGRTWTWVVGGVGLGLLAGGLVAGLAVKTEDDAYKQALAGTQNGNGTTQVNDPTALAAQHDANASLGTKATILTISGAVLLAGGVVLFFVEPGMGGGDSGSNGNMNRNGATPSKPGKGQPKDDGPGFSGQNDAPPPAPLPAVSSLSFGAAPVQGGGAVAVAGHF